MTQPRTILSLLGALALVATLGPAAGAHPDAGTASDGVDEHSADQLHGPAENVVADSLSDHDVSTGDIVSSGPTGNRIKDLTVVGRGIRNVPNATTDVWALDGYAYTGTFNDPCGGDPEAGIWVWDVHNPNRPEFVTVIPSPV